MASLNNKNNEKGFLLLDVLVGLFIVSIIMTAFLGSVVVAVKYARAQAKATQAELLAVEMVEAARELESSDWPALSTGVCAVSGIMCHPEASGSAWSLQTGAESIDAFTRSMTIEPVYRDGSFAVAPTGTEDLHAKRVVATVDWQVYGESKQLVLETYVYDYN